jgi:hypothetical protein
MWMPTLLIAKVPSNLLIPLMSKHNRCPLLESTHRKLCVWNIWLCKQVSMSQWCGCYILVDETLHQVLGELILVNQNNN